MEMKIRTKRKIIYNARYCLVGIIFLIAGLYIKELGIIGLYITGSQLIFVIGYTILYFFIEKLDIRLANKLFNLMEILCLLVIVYLLKVSMDYWSKI